MTVLGIGVDVLYVPRMAAVLKRSYGPRLVHRILSTPERLQWEALNGSGASSEERLRFLAVRWCVKEAAYKAMYPTVKPSWKDLAYSSFSREIKPQLQCLPLNAIELAKIDTIHVSVSHDGDYVLAQVLVEGNLTPA